MRFEPLYFDGCPSWHQALENLKQALNAEGLDMEISLVRVDGDSAASSLKFQGSPALRLSGEDLFPDRTGEHGFSCRVYQTEDGLRGWPTGLI